jgi:LytS/YehU family sensor histidine kinase
MNGSQVAIEKEIQYLQDYIGLQKLRKDDQYHIEFNCTPDVKGFLIEPLLLIPFVENAFKHISHNKNELNFIKMQLGMKKDEFNFSIENSKETGLGQLLQTEKMTEQHSGIGLANVKRRLALLYPQKHSLKITDELDIFNVTLSIKI